MAPGTIDIILAIYHRGAVPSNSDVSDSVSPIPLTQQTVLGRKSLFFWSIFVLGCYYSFNILYIICGFLPAFLSVSYSALYGQLSPRFQNIIDYVRELCLYITMFLYFLLLTIVWIALYGSFLAVRQTFVSSGSQTLV